MLQISSDWMPDSSSWTEHQTRPTWVQTRCCRCRGQRDIQDVLAIPTRAASFAQALEQVSAIYAAVGDRVRADRHPPLVADEGGWAPRLEHNEDALAWVHAAIQSAGVEARIAVD